MISTEKTAEKQKRGTILGLGVLLFATALLAVFWLLGPETNAQSAREAEIEDAVIAFLLADNNGYGMGEVQAEGHILLKTQKTETGAVVYLISSVGNYGFVNGNLEEVSGSGAIPLKLTLSRGDDGAYQTADYQYPQDGDMLRESLKELFPATLYRDVIHADRYYAALEEQKRAYAEAYLEETGRTAKVGTYGDFEHPFATDLGMSVQASNALMAIMEDYPFFIGTEERIEDGVRYVYENHWQESGDGAGIATYTKYNYETQECVARRVFRITGDTVTEEEPK